ncbi:dTDP-4-amino-4,6-dideoxy-D-galactose acyltransferase [Ursidibacter sp. B-7004-1]
MRTERNQWESDFFGREIYQIYLDELIPTKDINIPLFHQATSGDILYQAKILSTDLAKIDFLQAQGFRFVQGEMIFQLDLAKYTKDLTAFPSCRLATAQDLPTLKSLVATAFPNSRFRPPYFTQAENQRFYQQWIENAVKGEFDDLCLIAEQNGELQGAVSLRYNGEQAKIGLLAVSPEHQQQGVGKRLLHSAILQAKAQNTTQLEITTQLNNPQAIGLYQTLGAKIVAVNCWFYC